MEEAHTHKLSIAIQTNKTIPEYIAISKLVEELKFDCLTVYNDMLYQPSWIPLSIIAQATQRITIGVASVNPFTCHPINIAGNMALINEISKGRAYLGLSRGAWLDFVGVEPKRPLSALQDSILAIKHLLHQSKEPFKSDIYPVQGGDSLRWNISYPDVPIVLGSWGPNTIEKCKKLIHEVKLGGTANPELVPYYRSLVEGTAVSITLGCVTVVDEDSDKAREKARLEAALYVPVIAELDKTLKIEEEQLEEMKKLASEHNYTGVSELLDDELLEKFALAGTPEEIVEQTLAILKQGANRVEYGTPHGLEGMKGIQMLGEEVIPAVREKLGEQND